MPQLGPADIVTVWETASAFPDWDKALAVLSPMFPDVRPVDLARLSIGERNAHLLALRAGTIGPAMQAVVRCPECGEPLEFEQRIDELLDGYAPPTGREFEFTSGSFAIRYRLVDSDDLRGAARNLDEASARAVLVRRAVLAIAVDGEHVDANALPEDVLLALADDMSGNDPLALLAIVVACAACEHVWPATLEVVSFFWAELSRRARNILEDVVKLAREYGWSQHDILAMSEVRRQYYLDALD